VIGVVVQATSEQDHPRTKKTGDSWRVSRTLKRRVVLTSRHCWGNCNDGPRCFRSQNASTSTSFPKKTPIFFLKLKFQRTIDHPSPITFPSLSHKHFKLPHNETIHHRSHHRCPIGYKCSCIHHSDGTTDEKKPR